MKEVGQKVRRRSKRGGVEKKRKRGNEGKGREGRYLTLERGQKGGEGGNKRE